MSTLFRTRFFFSAVAILGMVWGAAGRGFSEVNAPLDSDLGKAVWNIIGAHHSPTGSEPERNWSLEQMVKANAVKANQLVIHEILSSQKYRPRLGDLWIGRVLEETARGGDAVRSREAALLWKAWLDLDLAAYDTAKDKVAFISTLPNEELWRLGRLTQRRNEVAEVLQLCQALGEKRLLGHDYDEMRAIWERSDIFLGSFTEVGSAVVLGSPGAVICSGKVEVTHALKGDLTGDHEAAYNRRVDPEEYSEDLPVRGRQYVIFARGGKEYIQIYKILPATEENIASIQKIVDRPLSEAVRDVISGFFTPDNFGSLKYAMIEKQVSDHAAEADQLLIHEILSEEKCRAKLGDFRVAVLLQLTADKDREGSREAALFYKAKADAALAEYDAAKDKDAYVASQPEETQWTLDRLTRNREAVVYMLGHAEFYWHAQRR